MPRVATSRSSTNVTTTENEAIGASYAAALSAGAGPASTALLAAFGVIYGSQPLSLFGVQQMRASTLAIVIAWAFVALRVVHSVIHLSYNRVLHSLAAFSAANTALAVLWVIAALHLAAAAP